MNYIYAYRTNFIISIKIFSNFICSLLLQKYYCLRRKKNTQRKIIQNTENSKRLKGKVNIEFKISCDSEHVCWLSSLLSILKLFYWFLTFYNHNQTLNKRREHNSVFTFIVNGFLFVLSAGSKMEEENKKQIQKRHTRNAINFSREKKSLRNDWMIHTDENQWQ